MLILKADQVHQCLSSTANPDNTALLAHSLHWPFSPNIALDKRVATQVFLLFLRENISCGYSLEVPHFLWRNKENINYMYFT